MIDLPYSLVIEATEETVHSNTDLRSNQMLLRNVTRQ